jgi:hypothetical protein
MAKVCAAPAMQTSATMSLNPFLFSVQKVTFSVHFEEHSPDSRNEIMRDTVIREIADLVPDDYKVADYEDPTCFTLM